MKSIGPILAVDIIITTPQGIVLIERKSYPKGWALPGGKVEYGETIEEAAVRETKEEISLDIRLIRQFHVYSDPKRDPRGHTVSTVFIAEPKNKKQKPKAESDAKGVGIFTKNTLPKNIVFDHRKILKDYFNRKY